MSALYDPSPEPREIEAPPPKEEEQAVSKTKLLKASGRHLLQVPKALTSTVGETVKGVVKSGAVWGLKRIKPPPLPFTAPRSRLNVPVSHQRTWSAAILPFARVKAIRAAAEATVNDVVLTICAGALRRYLLEKDDLPEKPLVAMVPVSVRAEDERGTMGNQVSAMLVSLATDVDDPLERLRLVHKGATGSKVHHQAIGARTLSDYSRFIPFGLAGAGARLYTRAHLAEKHRPIFNLVITNVPGPQIPLYVAGAKLLAHIGAAPALRRHGPDPAHLLLRRQPGHRRHLLPRSHARRRRLHRLPGRRPRRAGSSGGRERGSLIRPHAMFSGNSRSPQRMGCPLIR